VPLPLVARLAHWRAPRTYRDRVTMKQAFTPSARLGCVASAAETFGSGTASRMRSLHL
jgi:hypothetical protein